MLTLIQTINVTIVIKHGENITKVEDNGHMPQIITTPHVKDVSFKQTLFMEEFGIMDIEVL
jgi:uncharacterized Rossmann fold enzyme